MLIVTPETEQDVPAARHEPHNINPNLPAMIRRQDINVGSQRIRKRIVPAAPILILGYWEEEGLAQSRQGAKKEGNELRKPILCAFARDSLEACQR
jgi:hypothetical protein